jgi:hypothetical protein
LIISKNNHHIVPEEFDEENLSTEQYQAKKDARLFGKDEHKERPECFEAEAGEGKEETYRLISGPGDILFQGKLQALWWARV